MNLLDRIKTSLAGGDDEAGDPEHTRRLAAAVLLLEMEHVDHVHEPDERAEIRRQLKTYFDLHESEVDELIEAAEPEQRESISLHRFLQALNEGMDAAAKREVVEMLWRVAYADRELDAHEEHLLRHIAELLHLPHSEFIKAKLSVTGE